MLQLRNIWSACSGDIIVGPFDRAGFYTKSTDSTSMTYPEGISKTKAGDLDDLMQDAGCTIHILHPASASRRECASFPERERGW
jgi:hypothetical protein